MSKLAASVIADSLESFIKELRSAEEEGSNLIEVRLDYLIPTAEIEKERLRDILFKITSACPQPLIWTLRHESEGGRFTGSIASQLAILSEAIEIGGEFIDIEYHRWIEARTIQKDFLKKINKLRSDGRDIKIIFSYHNFETTPEWLDTLAARIYSDLTADIVKIACKVNNICENFLLLDLYKSKLFAKVRSTENDTSPFIFIGMDTLGQITRILVPKFGGYLSYAAISSGRPAAPGQLTIRELKEDYNWEKILPSTMIAGVIGCPVGHSLSPVMHNLAYRLLSIDAVYLKFEVKPRYEEFSTFMDLLRKRSEWGFWGLSVTIPHKENAVRYLLEHNFRVDPIAEKIGAVNTIVILPDGSLEGTNTDYIGILKALEVRAGLTKDMLRSMKIAILGAGGAARAAILAMQVSGAKDITIYNRTEAKAKRLAEEFECRYKKWSELQDVRESDLIINCTSVGMSGTGTENVSLLTADSIRTGSIVFDTVYTPMETTLIRTAEACGARTVEGVYMLAYQAAEQIRIWAEANNLPCKARIESIDDIPLDPMLDALIKRVPRRA